MNTTHTSKLKGYGTLAACWLAAVGAFATASTAAAAPTGPVYPPPGGVTFSGTGSAGAAGGRNNSYTVFDNSAFSALYWGASSASLPAAGLDGALHTMTFGGVSGTQAWWDVSSNWTNPTNSLTTSETIRLLITISGLSGSPWIDATTVGLPSSIGWVVDNSLGQNFVANLSFFVPTEGNAPLNSLQQPAGGCGVGPCTLSSFTGGFYYLDPQSVPEPGSLALAGLGLIGLAMSRRARAVAGEPTAPRLD